MIYRSAPVPLKIILLGLFSFSMALFFQIARIGFLILSNSGQVRNARPYEQNPPGARAKILFVGDSIAVGVGAKDPQTTIAGRLGKDFPQAQICNRGISGLRIHRLAREFNPEELGPYDLIVAQIGANDIIRFTPLDQLEADLITFLSKAKKISKQIVVLHSGNVGSAPFFPVSLEYFWRKRSLEVRAIYRRESKKFGAAYVNLFKERADDPFLKDIKKFYSPDLLHPSGDGYGLWYQRLRETMSEERIVIP